MYCLLTGVVILSATLLTTAQTPASSNSDAGIDTATESVFLSKELPQKLYADTPEDSYPTPQPNGEGNLNGILLPRTDSSTTNFNIALSNQYITAAADSQYITSSFREIFFGDHYRESWAAPIRVPTISFGEHLKLTGKSSGIQTETLFAVDSTGQRFAIRTLHKDLEQFIPRILQRNFIVDVVQDQVSAAYPYSKLIATPLAKAANIFTTDARVAFVLPPDSSQFDLRTQKGNMAIIEEFVSGNLVRDKYELPVRSQTFSTEEVMNRLLNEPALSVDKINVLRTRLFDMLINDWHRHEEQYIWVEVIEPDGKNTLRPFSIDRDNAFLLTDGLFPWAGSRKWGMRKFQNFSPQYRDVAGLNYVARHFDRRFLYGISQHTWTSAAKQLQHSLTDSVIHNAVRQLPKELYQQRGDFFQNTLKKRRDHLLDAALRYYNILHKQIDLVGTNFKDTYKIEYNEEGNIRFISKTEMPDTDNSIANRDTLIVNPDITQEVRLYGMDEKDTFILNIASKLPIKIHVVGGNNRQDVFIRDDIVRSMGNFKSYNINIPRKSDLTYSDRTKKFTRQNINFYGYNYQEFEYGKKSPVVDLSINEDDGLFLGGGINLISHGFRKYPYASKQTLSANAAFNTGSFNANYRGEFIRAVGKADLILNTSVSIPNSRTNFFGFGNETKEINNTDFHTVRIDQIFNMALLRYKLLRFFDLEIGPTFEIYNPKLEQNRFVSTPASGLGEEDFETKSFLGIVNNFNFDFSNQKSFNKRGLEAQFSTKFMHGFDDNEPRLIMKYKLRYYRPLHFMNSMLATRVGMARNIGDFEFYQANTLGGQLSANPNISLMNSGNFRGIPRHRFSGRTVFYQNTDLRIPLFKASSFFIPGTFGILTLVDHGRVWNSNTNSSKWHVGKGGGIWYNALNRFLLSTTWATSDVDQTISFNLGFMF
mgnify:FL=1